MARLRTIALCAALGLGLAGALKADPADDQLTLKDGRVVTGQVVEESQDSITLLVKGVTRHYKRDLVKKVAYGSGSAEAPPPDGEPAAATVPAGEPAAKPAVSLDVDIAQRYQVPMTEVAWVRRQGITEADLPIVFFVAASAGITPGPVVRLRLEGWSWRDIERHYGMDPARIYYAPGPWVPYPYFAVGYGYGWGWGGGGGYRGGWGGGGYRGGGGWGGGWHHR